MSPSIVETFTLPSSAGILADFLLHQDVQAHFVGGVIRDSLLKIETADIDVAVEGNALIIGKAAASNLKGTYIELDRDRGICRVVVAGEKGFQADFVSANEGIKADLARRDFTINSMAMDIESVRIYEGKVSFTISNLIDPLNGRSDLNSGKLRAVSTSSLSDDPVRLMRAVRLSSQYGLRLEDKTYNQIKNIAPKLKGIAPERIRDEFLKTLSLRGASDSIRLMDKLGLLEQIIPEINQSRGVVQPKEHYWNVFEHLIECVGRLERILQPQFQKSGHCQDDYLDLIPRFQGIEKHFDQEVGDGHTRLTVCKVACLLHDIAKPATKTVEPTGKIRFLGHHKEGAKMAESILKRLRFSGKSILLIADQVKHHLRPSQMAPPGELPSNKAISRYFRDVGNASIDNLYLNLADYMSARGPLLEEHEWKQHCGVINHILSKGLHEKDSKKPPKLVTGHDIMCGLSLAPGPLIGQLLAEVEEARSEGILTNREDALEFLRMRPLSGE